MEGKTHILGGISVGLLYITATKTSLAMGGATLAAAVAGSLFPDLDINKSIIGSKIKPVSNAINRIFGHRTLFHSLVLYVGIYAVFRNLIKRFPSCWLGFSLGAASHLFLDMLNYKGIALLYPYPKQFHLANIKYGGETESILRVIMSGCIVLCIAEMILTKMFFSS